MNAKNITYRVEHHEEAVLSHFLRRREKHNGDDVALRDDVEVGDHDENDIVDVKVPCQGGLLEGVHRCDVHCRQGDHVHYRSELAGLNLSVSQEFCKFFSGTAHSPLASQRQINKRYNVSEAKQKCSNRFKKQ